MTIDTTDQQAVTVAQEDREAAANMHAYIMRELGDAAPAKLLCDIMTERMRTGWHDNSEGVQAFARHRPASVSSASVETLALQAIKVVTATAKDGAAGLSRIMAIANAAGVQASYNDLLQDPAVALIVEHPRTEWTHLFKPDAKGCAIPPDGWQCSRARGHAGPCAASPEPVPATNQAGEVAERARELAHRIILEFRPNGWEAKEKELYRLLLGSFEAALAQVKAS